MAAISTAEPDQDKGTTVEAGDTLCVPDRSLVVLERVA